MPPRPADNDDDDDIAVTTNELLSKEEGDRWGCWKTLSKEEQALIDAQTYPDDTEPGAFQDRREAAFQRGDRSSNADLQQTR